MQSDLTAFLILLLIFASRFAAGEPYLLPLFWLCAFIAAVIFREKSNQRRLRFINQLKSQRRELRRGGAVVVDGMILRYGSELTSYRLSVGALLVSVDFKSQFHSTADAGGLEGLLYSAVSLVSGWWSFPHGPLHTLNALAANIFSGERISVAKLIDGPLLEKHALLQKRQNESKQSVIPKEQPAPKLGTTGAGSPSISFIMRRTVVPDPPTLSERIRELAEPTPPGKRAALRVQAALERQRVQLRARAGKFAKEQYKRLRQGPIKSPSDGTFGPVV